MIRCLPFALLVSLALSAGPACGGSDLAPGADGGVEPDAPVGSNDGELPPRAAQVGVAYVAHFNSAELRSYRLDTAEPEAGPVVDLGAGVHDLVIDADNHRLAVVSDVGRWVRLYALDVPAAPGAPIAAPARLSEIPLDDIPRFAAINPYRHRLYVLTADPEQSPLETMELHGYDISDAEAPSPLDGWPQTVAVTVSSALDPARDVWFAVELTSDRLVAYDLGGDGFEALDGAPVELTEIYPQENQFAFQARGLSADVRRHRLVAARSQSALSELIAFDYPADIPAGGARYRDFVTMDDLTPVADDIDVDLPLDQRPNLLDAYAPAIDGLTGMVFLSADAWNGSASTATVAVFDAAASLGAGCDETPGEGFGCFLRSHSGGVAGAYTRTDGALCVDGDHQRVVATSFDPADETAPGMVHVFDYAGDMTMRAALPAGGGDLEAGALPIGAVCH